MKKQLGPFSFVIDRPKGTVKEWPQSDGSVKRFVYPCDYGYWPKIKGEDGEGLDAFVGDDPKGHKESFQKLNPDGTPDETKFLLGVTDRQREAIYGLYKTEVNARRVYDDWDDVQAALDEYKGKMHKTAASTEQVARAKALLEDPAFVWHGTNSPSDGASTGKIRYGGGLDALGKGVYLGAKPQMEYWNGAGYAVPRAHLSRDHIDLSSFGNRWQVDPKDVPLRDGAVAFVHPSLYEEAKTRFGSHGVDVLPLDALHEARGGKLPNQPIGGFGPETPAKQQSTQSKVNDYLPAGLIALQTAASALRDYKINTEDAGVLPYRRDAYRISPATVGTVAGGALGYGLGKLFKNVNPLRHISGLRAPAHPAMIGSVLGATLGARSDDNLERSHVFRQLENAHAARSRGENEKLRTTKSKLTDVHNLRGTANAALTGHDPDRNVIVADAQALAKSLKDPTRDVGFFASRSAPIDKKYRDWVRSGREMGKDRGLYVGKREIKSAEHSHRWSYGYLPGTGYRHCACGEIEEVFPSGPPKPMAEKEKGFVRRHLEKSAAYLFGEKLAMDPFASMNWVPSNFAGRVQSPGQIMQASQVTPALAGTQENIRMLQLAQDPFTGAMSGSPTPGVRHHRHRRHHR